MATLLSIFVISYTNIGVVVLLRNWVLEVYCLLNLKMNLFQKDSNSSFPSIYGLMFQFELKNNTMYFLDNHSACSGCTVWQCLHFTSINGLVMLHSHYYWTCIIDDIHALLAKQYMLPLLPRVHGNNTLISINQYWVLEINCHYRKKLYNLKSHMCYESACADIHNKGTIIMLDLTCSQDIDRRMMLRVNTLCEGRYNWSSVRLTVEVHFVNIKPGA